MSKRLAMILVLALFLVAPLQGTSLVQRQMAERAGREVVEISVAGQVVLRIRAPHGGLSVEERGRIVEARLLRLLGGGVTGEGIIPDVVNGQHAVTIDGQLLITVDKEHARLNGCEPWELALIWANNLRRALGISPIAIAAPAIARGDGSFVGTASWYGDYFHGRPTASGEIYDQYGLTAAHRDWEFDTWVRVTNLHNGRHVIVKINDRGPFIEGRYIDLSRGAAQQLQMVERGLALVKLEILDGVLHF
ncbi:MAG: septal ring lytic transglycosylase RlpA family protein [Limnochordia bacterium]|jgi:hypothetical protein